MCGKGIEWDEGLPEPVKGEWKTLIEDLRHSQPVSIPRSYIQEGRWNVHSSSLTGFCDASMTAYAAIVYLVVRTEIRVHTQFVICKTRVAPMQSITIPRLELLSALLLARLIVTVSRSLTSVIPCHELKCYTDSMVALHWIRGLDKEWRQFVANRVNEIREKTPPSCWSHCPGVSNPADLPTRGMGIDELRVSRLWRFGPDWLQSDVVLEDKGESTQIPEECSLEMKTSHKKVHNLVTVEGSHTTIGEVIECKKFSSFHKLIRITAYVLRAVRCFKAKAVSEPTYLTSTELSEAEQRWIKDCQKMFCQEKSFQSLKFQLNLFLDESGLWRCGGRLTHANIPYSTKYPLLLCRDHPLTSLIVSDAHRCVLHDGVRETLNQVRGKYWIVRGRSLVRKLIRCCVTCRKYEGAPFSTPPPPPLPQSRVKDAPAFSYSGVDFAGPLVIRISRTSKKSKAWICLFTCFITRAVHLDIVTDLSTETFLRCLKRFVARRGLPYRFISDNGKTFKAASQVLKSVFRDDTVQLYLAERGCKWTFNVERAPWWGGAFERLVRSTKRCLKKVIGRACFTLDELLTSVIEIEAIINSRPLSYIAAEDTEEPLTPSHLLIGRSVNAARSPEPIV